MSRLHPEEAVEDSTGKAAVQVNTPSQRLQSFIDNNTLIRNDWGDGYKRACLLAALVPQCATQTSAKACPAEILPYWFADLTVDFDDKGTVAAWPDMVQRFQKLVARNETQPLSAEAWERARMKTLRHCVNAANDVCVERRPYVQEVLQWLNTATSAECPPVLASPWTWSVADDVAWYALQPHLNAACVSNAARMVAESRSDDEYDSAVLREVWDGFTSAILGFVEEEFAQ